jgi:4-carboxymuconolactone decarboxylase
MTSPYEQGLNVRREVLGQAHVDRSLASATEFSAPWQEFITSVVWGEVWSRDGLDRRTRSMLTVALLAALHCENELPMHIRAAIGNGVTPAELREVLMHTAVYAGVPAANSAFAVAQQVLVQLGAVGPPVDSLGGDDPAGSP